MRHLLMGENGPVAVVDEQARVHGVEGLRVIDASIIPFVLSCNINAPTIMLAQKLSDSTRCWAGDLCHLCNCPGISRQIDSKWPATRQTRHVICCHPY